MRRALVVLLCLMLTGIATAWAQDEMRSFQDQRLSSAPHGGPPRSQNAVSSDDDIRELARQHATREWWELGGAVPRDLFHRYLVPQLTVDETLQALARQCWTYQWWLSRYGKCL